MLSDQQTLVVAVVLLLMLFVALHRRKWRSSGAHGTARWATESDLEAKKMFGKNGLILGRTRRKGKLLRIPRYQHLSVYAPTGAGKGVSFVVPTLLDYRRGSVFVFDPKGELFRISSGARARMGDRIIRLDPFGVCGPGGDCFNPFREIRPGPTLIDDARAAAEAMIVRPAEGDRDPFWNNSAAALLTSLTTATLLLVGGDDRNLSTVREFLTDPGLLKVVIAELQKLGGIPARLGNQVERQSMSEKEFAGVVSTANTHSNFLDSELVAAMINRSTFSADVLLRPGTTIYFILPVEQLDAQRNLLRLVVSTLLRHVMQYGVKNGGEVLWLLDEASLLSELDALSQALVLGRGRGIKLYMFWQTLEQSQVAFRGRLNLVSDNSDAKMFFGVNSFSTAELVSKSLGNTTILTESTNESKSVSMSQGYGSPSQNQTSWTTGRNFAEQGRALVFAEEVMRTSGELLIAFVKGVPPILARRIKYFSDPLFRPGATFWQSAIRGVGWVLVLASLAVVARAAMSH
jgi:type IV secretion system protein VirD4